MVDSGSHLCVLLLARQVVNRIGVRKARWAHTIKQRKDPGSNLFSHMLEMTDSTHVSGMVHLGSKRDVVRIAANHCGVGVGVGFGEKAEQ